MKQVDADYDAPSMKGGLHTHCLNFANTGKPADSEDPAPLVLKLFVRGTFVPSRNLG